jgi:lipopolysaccharide export system protein LptA
VCTPTKYALSICVLTLLLGAQGSLWAQKTAISDSVQPTQVSVKSGYFEKSPEYPEAVIYSRDQNGPVHIEHDGVQMWCDQALVYFKENFVKAYGSVKIAQGDTINMFSDYGEYNGDTSFAFAAGNVVLDEPQTNLTSDTLYFDRQKQEAYYRSGGTVRDSSSVLTSRVGRYFTNTKKYQFESDVTITNPKYTVHAPRIDFYTESGLAYLYGASSIESETSTIYCDRGYYNTRSNIGHFVKNSRVDYNNRILYGDSIYFDRAQGFASATNHIKIIDSLNKTVVHGHYAEVFKAQDSVFITNRAVAVSLQEQDSVYIHADTLRITGKPDQRVIKGFYEARFFKPGATIAERTSGRCDSIVVTQKIGLTEMLGRPVLWSGENQITGDTIHLIQNLVREDMDSLKVFDNAFLIQKDLEGYNQVKGAILIGHFTENKLDTIDIVKNSQVIFYSRNDQEALVGINHTVSSAIQLYLKDQKINGIRFINKVPGKVYPPSEFPENARILPGFLWRGTERLFYIEDLFAGKTFPELRPIRGIPLPDPIDNSTVAGGQTENSSAASESETNGSEPSESNGAKSPSKPSDQRLIPNP